MKNKKIISIFDVNEIFKNSFFVNLALVVLHFNVHYSHFNDPVFVSFYF
ncbi:hypothetical protein PHEL49_0173 [Polaribacter sp. Hel1_33_49]|nr:hypothetical protein PHEL49_0173 [Polaribacter sp. Hel1_33_49]